LQDILHKSQQAAITRRGSRAWQSNVCAPSGATVFAAKVLGLKKSSGSLVGRLTAVLAMGATCKRGARVSVTAADQTRWVGANSAPTPHFPPANHPFTKTLQIFEIP